MTTSVRDFARPAIDDQPTRRAFRRYVLRCVRAAALGFVSLVLAVVVVNVSPGHNPGGLAVLAAVLGFSGGGVAFAIGVGSLLRSIRMRIVLGHHPWVMRSSRYRIAAADRSNGQPALVINELEGRPEAVCSVSATVWRYRKLHQGIDQPVLVAGNPLRWAVVAPPDLGVLVVAKRPWSCWWQRRLRAIATR